MPKEGIGMTEVSSSAHRAKIVSANQEALHKELNHIRRALQAHMGHLTGLTSITTYITQPYPSPTRTTPTPPTHSPTKVEAHVLFLLGKCFMQGCHHTPLTAPYSPYTPTPLHFCHQHYLHKLPYLLFSLNISLRPGEAALA